MNLEILQKINEAGCSSANEFVHAYVTNEDAIVNDIQNLNGIKSEFYCRNFYDSVDATKFLSLYSDFTSVFMLPDKVKEHLIHFYPPEDPLFIKRQVTFPSELLNGSIPKPHEILPGYTTQNDADLSEVFKRLEPLVKNGKFMLRPIRTIMLENHPNEKKVDRIIYYANSDTPNNHWNIKKANEPDSYVIDNGLKNFQSDILYEVTLPYLSNLSILNLSKILEEETDLLASFRITLKELMLSNLEGQNVDINELHNDVIRPQIETINRKFKSITNVHKLSLGASVTAITISLLGISNLINLDFQTLFNPALGGLGIVASEIKFQKDQEKLKDNPYFLLWKIRKANIAAIKNQFK